MSGIFGSMDPLGLPATTSDALVTSDDSTPSKTSQLQFTGNPNDILNGAGSFTAGHIFNIVDNGADPTGVNDSAAAIQDTIDDAALVSGTVFVPQGSFTVLSTVNFPYNVSWAGAGAASIIQAGTGSSYTGGYIIRFNRVTNDTSWDQSYPAFQGYIRDLTISNVNTQSDVNYGIYVADRRFIENVRFRYLHKAIGYTTEYMDSKKIRGVHVSQSMSDSEYAIDSGSLGDALHFDSFSIDFHSSVSTASQKALRLNACLGGSVTNAVINGEFKVIKGRGVTLSNLHCEFAPDKTSIIIEDSPNVTVRDSYIEVGSEPGITVTKDGLSARGQVLLDNVHFIHPIGTDTISSESQGYDIATDSQVLVIRDCQRSILKSGAIQYAYQTGISVYDTANATGLDDFNNRSALLSRDCVIRGNIIVDYHKLVHGGDATSLPAAGSIVNNINVVDWSGATGTYYYTTVLLTDVSRMIGQTTNEVSVSLTNGGNGATYTLVPTAVYERVGMWRVYRGTASGSYDQYVDIPAQYVIEMFDSGSYLSGYPWISRTAGAIDAINGFIPRRVELTRENVIAWVDIPAVPTAGTWFRCDLIKDATPSSASPTLEVCTLTGGPGVMTWSTGTGI